MKKEFTMDADLFLTESANKRIFVKIGHQIYVKVSLRDVDDSIDCLKSINAAGVNVVGFTYGTGVVNVWIDELVRK